MMLVAYVYQAIETFQLTVEQINWPDGAPPWHLSRIIGIGDRFGSLRATIDGRLRNNVEDLAKDG